MVSAPAKLSPWPPALVLRRKINVSSSSENFLMARNLSSPRTEPSNRSYEYPAEGEVRGHLTWLSGSSLTLTSVSEVVLNDIQHPSHLREHEDSVTPGGGGGGGRGSVKEHGIWRHMYNLMPLSKVPGHGTASMIKVCVPWPWYSKHDQSVRTLVSSVPVVGR